MEDVVVTGFLPRIAGNVTYCDISYIVTNHDGKSDVKKFLDRSIIAQATESRSQAYYMWTELNRLYYYDFFVD